jgi:uncharacterized lipoprotein YddW (UPF0748 family)
VRAIFFLLWGWLILVAAQSVQAAPQTPPGVAREFRAAWIATVGNINFPSQPGLSVETLQQEIRSLMDSAERLRLNAIIFQVRPACDAIYSSEIEPWSYYLSGDNPAGIPRGFDPLTYAIEQAHARGLELHAWFNPYRAALLPRRNNSPKHVLQKHPEWVRRFGNNLWLDPGLADVQDYVAGVILDVVRRYDIDGVHLDDYFYPYPIPGKVFPDYHSFLKYGKGRKRDDWRRSNVDSIIFRLYRTIKVANKDCQFGISPFGVWRNQDKDPRGSTTQAGPTNYDFLYADILLWLQKGWIDYVTPQLYWEIGHPAAEYQLLVDWWSRNSFGKNCYIGLGPYKAGSNAAWKDKTQLPRQILKIRETPNINGMAFFSSKSLEKNLNGWSDSLRTNYFREPASPPKIP